MLHGTSGLYEVIWSPLRDEETHIKRDLYIKVVLSGKYSSERKIKTLEYVYLQDTVDPDDEEDLGIHTWKLIADDIPYVGKVGGKLKFELEGSSAWTHINEYEKINQGNPRFRSVERLYGFNPKGKLSKLIVLLDPGGDWFVDAPVRPIPKIDITPQEINFGNLKQDREHELYYGQETFTIRNVGEGALDVIDVSVEDRDDEYVTIDLHMPNSTLSPQATYWPGESGTYRVTAVTTDAVDGKAVGEFTAKVYVQSSDPVNPTAYINVRGFYIPTNIPSVIELLLLRGSTKKE